MNTVTMGRLNYLNQIVRNSKMYKTEAEAFKKLQEWSDVIDDLPCCVLTTDRGYVPVVFLRPKNVVMAGPMARDGITVAN